LDRVHQLSVVMADDTRYRVYRSMVERPGEQVTVADVAARFGLHPNVARMHLGKLERAGLLLSSLRHTATGGRPAKLYAVSDRAESFAYPPRRYELLSRLALAALQEGGDEGAVTRICTEAGLEEARRHVGDKSGALGRDAILGSVRHVAEEQGLFPELEWNDADLIVDVRNCVFRELSKVSPDLVCAMHRSFLLGVIEGIVGGTVTCAPQTDSISRGADRCRMTCSLGERGHERRAASQ
jgi:predicted ArsR family transcriptional regulator